jgi:hypothetical protein
LGDGYIQKNHSFLHHQINLKILVMKKLSLLAMVVFVFASLQTQAKIWRVNNSPSLSADVLQASTLFDGTNNVTNPEAAAGDSVYFEPSTLVYNGFDINKLNIVVLGYGYLLSSNPGMQANTNNARVQDIGFQVGSAGSSISGLEIVGGIYFYTNNVTATRCNTANVFIGNQTTGTGLRLDKCCIRSSMGESGIAASVTSVTIAIENCIFSSVTDGTFISGINFGQKVKGLFRNNVLNYLSTFYCYNFYIANNIIVNAVNFGTVSNTGNNVFRNNLFSYPIAQSQYAQVGGVANANAAPNAGNVFSVNMANVFNGPTNNVYNGTSVFNDYILAGTFTTESRFELKAGSTAIAAGETGVTLGSATVTTPNCGAFGATDPYRKGGFPAIPRIYSLSVPATVTNNAANMTISISSASNN